MRTLLWLALATLLPVLAGCSGGIFSGSGGAETEARTIALLGRAYFQDTSAAAGARVYVQALDSTDANDATYLAAVTRNDGTYSIDSLAQGRYLLTVVAGDSALAPGALFEIAVETAKKAGSEQYAPNVYLRPSGSICGTIGGFSLYSGIGVAVSLIYHDFVYARSTVDPSGKFHFPIVPAGTYSLAFVPSEASYSPFTRHDIVVAPSQTVELFFGGLISVFSLADNPQYIADSLAVQTILSANGLSTPVSSVVRLSEQYRISGLYLRGLGLRQLPDSLSRLSALRVLDIQDNQLSALPDCFDLLAQLRTINADNNHLAALPPSIVQLDSLVTLRVAGNRLETLPQGIGQLGALTELSAADNLLTELPASIGNCRQLRILSLQNNALRALPNTLGGCVSLETLTLQNNRLDSLPAALTRLPLLAKLSLRGNQIVVLPDSLGQLRNLDLLWLEHNRLRTLPTSIGACAALRFLVLSNNELTTLPEQLGELSGLVELSLDSNQLDSLPSSIVGLNGLALLDLSANRLCSLTSQLREWADQFDPGWERAQECSGVAPAPITVTAPLAGQRVVPGQVVRIAWETNPLYGGNDLAVTIEISIDSGSTWQKVAESPVTVKDPRWGNYSWTVPDSLITPNGMISAVSQGCQIRVADYFDPYFYGESPLFSVTLAALTVTAPAGAQSYAIGDTLHVRWDVLDGWILSVDIFLSLDSGETWIGLNRDKAITVNDLRWRDFAWVIPEFVPDPQGSGVLSVVSANCLIRIGDYFGCAYDNCHEDISDGVFAIVENRNF